VEASRIAELRSYLAKRRQIQTWSVRGLVAGVVLAAILGVAAGVAIWLPIAALSAIIGGAGFWITRGHIEELEQQLRARGRSRR
jgi:hypothetical protein